MRYTGDKTILSDLDITRTHYKEVAEYCDVLAKIRDTLEHANDKFCHFEYIETTEDFSIALDSMEGALKKELFKKANLSALESIKKEQNTAYNNNVQREVL